MNRKEVHSLKELQLEVAGILDRVNRDANLSRSALVNPILALEELGYDIAPRFRPSLEHRLRFSLGSCRRLERLQREIFAAAGHEFAINEPRDLHRVLFEELRLSSSKYQTSHPTAAKAESARPPYSLNTEPLPPHGFGRPPAADPLQPLAGAHPIMPPLLEYRLLESSQPRFAPRALYQEVKAGGRAGFVTGVRARLKQTAKNVEEDARDETSR
jgi:hypothetical protein